MPGLHPREIDCLRRIARGEIDAGGPCTDEVLRRLAGLGFIERVPTLCLPLEMPRAALHLTPAGRAALEPD